MYFATYKYDGKEDAGVLNPDKTGVISFKDLFKVLNAKVPETMNEFIDICTDDLISAMQSAVSSQKFDEIPLKSVKFCAPIPYPKRQVFCLGKNYVEHAKEIKETKISASGIPELPIYFYKVADPAIGDGDTIKNHKNITNQIDYEAELAIIIGKDGTNIKKEDAEDYIFGYTIANDVSARDLQSNRKQWFMGKSLDTFCPMGPFIVHKNKIPFPVELNISSKVNGELRQNSNTKKLIFDIPHIISDLSSGISLKKGDIILTGTPAGVGLGFKPPKFLKSGDVIECSIEKIGTLMNKIE